MRGIIPKIMGAAASFSGAIGSYHIAKYYLAMREAMDSAVIINMGSYSVQDAYKSLYGVNSGDVAVGVLLVGCASLIGGLAYGFNKKTDEKFFRSWDNRNIK